MSNKYKANKTVNPPVFFIATTVTDAKFLIACTTYIFCYAAFRGILLATLC